MIVISCFFCKLSSKFFNMKNSTFIFSLFLFLIACSPSLNYEVNPEVLTSLGESVKISFTEMSDEFATSVSEDPENIEALTGLAEMKILLYVFGFVTRDETLPEVRLSVQKLMEINPEGSNTYKLSGILNFLDVTKDQGNFLFMF